MDFANRLFGIAFVVLMCVACVARAQSPAQNAAFVLGPGDLIELNVHGEAGGRQQVRVGEDGRILAPLIGLFSVAEMTPEAAVDALAKAYVDGDWLNEPQISMTLIDGRPYYVAGDVRQPGAYPSRPRMTVEEALAIAGGFRFAGFLNPLEYSEERFLQDLTAAWVDLFEAQLGSARRRAEIAQADTITMPEMSGNPLPRDYIDRRMENETAILEVSNAKHRRREVDLAQSIEVTEGEIAAALDVRDQLAQSRRVLETLVAQQEELLSRGLQVRANLFEAQQNLAAAVARLSGQEMTEGQARRRLINLKSELDGLEQERRARLLGEVSNYEGAAVRLRAALEAIDTRRILAFSVTGTSEEDVTTITFRIRRGPPDARETIVATPGTTILPGDILNVSVVLSIDGQ